MSNFFSKVDVGDGASMMIPKDELQWQLRYGTAPLARLLAADIISSFDYLLGTRISTKEAIRRLRLLRHRYAAETPQERTLARQPSPTAGELK